MKMLLELKLLLQIAVCLATLGACPFLCARADTALAMLICTGHLSN